MTAREFSGEVSPPGDGAAGEPGGADGAGPGSRPRTSRRPSGPNAIGTANVRCAPEPPNVTVVVPMVRPVATSICASTRSAIDATTVVPSGVSVAEKPWCGLSLLVGTKSAIRRPFVRLKTLQL